MAASLSSSWVKGDEEFHAKWSAFEEKFDKKEITHKNVALLDWDQKSPRFTSYLRSSQNFLACNFIEKATLTQVFSCEFIKISKNTVFKEHLWATISEVISETSGIFFSFLLQLLWCPYRRSLSGVFQKKFFLENSTNSTGSHLCRNLSLVKLKAHIL